MARAVWPEAAQHSISARCAASSSGSCVIARRYTSTASRTRPSATSRRPGAPGDGPLPGSAAGQKVAAVDGDRALQVAERGRRWPRSSRFGQRLLELAQVAVERPGLVECVTAVGEAHPARVAERAPQLPQGAVQGVAQLALREFRPQREANLLPAQRR